jgi:hypothetical protein
LRKLTHFAHAGVSMKRREENVQEKSYKDIYQAADAGGPDLFIKYLYHHTGDIFMVHQ